MRILFLLCLFVSGWIQAQDYYIKSYSAPAGIGFYSGLEATTDGGLLHVSQLTSREILLRRVDKCGGEVWQKTIRHDSLPMDMVDLKRDTAGNFIFAGNLGEFNRGGRPFVMSIAEDGSVNYFKSVNLPTNIESITYSFLQNKDGDFYLYFNYDTGGSNRSQISVAKMDAQGDLIWFKSFSNMANWGRAIATSDGGLLFRAGSSYAKIDVNGTVEWSKTYQRLGYVDYPIEVAGGYLLFKYPSGASNNTTNLIKIDGSGEIKWVSNDYRNFTPRRGILRKNGNALFTGATSGVGLLEVDTATGNIVRFKEYNPSTNFTLAGTDVYEDEQQEVLVSGTDNSGIIPASLYLKVDSSLGLPSCSPTDLLVSAIRTPNVIALANTVSTINQSSQLLSIADEQYLDSNISLTTASVSCSFTENRGVLDLGRDTILCPEELMVIGSSNTNFDAYFWSNGANTKQITVAAAGTYILQVLAACDTLSDTINIAYYPDVEFFIGEDTSICNGDSLQLSSDFALSNYLWSTGDTSPSITVKNEGVYWLETATVCGKVRDSIQVSVFPQASRLNLGADTNLCPGEELLLGDSLTDFDRFSWSTGETTPFITIQDSGLYVLEATTVCDTLRDSIQVGLNPTLAVSFATDKQLSKTFEPIQFIRNERNGIAVNWDFGDGESASGDTAIHEYKVAGNYNARLIVTSAEGCEFSASQGIVVQPSDYSLPNVFSPNNDGINDEFKPLGKDIQSYRLRVYDRWGREVFSKRETAWDGRNKNGRTLSSGVYFYVITLYWNHGGSIELEGNLQLLR